MFKIKYIKILLSQKQQLQLVVSHEMRSPLARMRLLVELLPTPENTIFLLLIPAFSAFISSPFETTSAPQFRFLISLNILLFELDLTEKQTKGLILEK